MSFTGKSTYGAGADLPELVEDVSDVIGIVSPHETPLLDHLGDPRRVATSTVHEWVEDALAPNTAVLDNPTFSPSPTTDMSLTVNDGSRFAVGDLVRPEGKTEVMLVTGILLDTLTVVRGYGGTTPATLVDGMTMHILGNAALEGAASPTGMFTNRVRQQNYTQIFTAGVEVSGSMQAARQHGVDDELDFQKQERLRELLRDLENTVINGVAASSSPQGSSTVRRSMNGIVPMIQSNQFLPGVGGLPDGTGSSGEVLTEQLLNAALERVWESSSGTVDTIVLNGTQKRALNAFIGTDRRFSAQDEVFKNLVSVYESDFGVCRVILTRGTPSDTVLMLDSTRLSVLPMAGRSFHFKPLASVGDSLTGQMIGEYTLEMRNENAHGLIRGLSTTGD